MFVPLEFPQGVRSRGTTYSEGPRVVAANLIRWRGSNIVPVGGWQLLLAQFGSSTIRSLFSWVDSNGTKWTAIGTTGAVFAYNGTTAYVVSPLDWVASPALPSVLAGYGTGLFSTGNYSDPVGEDPAEGGPLTSVDYGVVQFANWGENLLFCSTADGRLIEWNPNTPLTLGVVVANAPTRIRSLAVTRERHVVVTGFYDVAGTVEIPQRASWSVQENNAVWAPTPINTAGDLDVVSQTYPLRCINFRDETLIFTNTSLHRLRYVGPPYIYVMETIATDCGLLCPQAIARSASRLFWLSRRGFFQYDGGAATPVVSQLTDRFEGLPLGDIGFATVAVGHNEVANEFWCFYPTTPGNPNRYVAWNYNENWWTEGELARTAWIDNFAGSFPLAANGSVLYEHELSPFLRADYTGAPSFTTGPIEIGQGDRFVAVQRLVSDIEGANAPLNATLTFYDYPQGQVLKGITFVLTPPKQDIRGVGRAVELTVSESVGTPSGAWVLGKCRLDIQPGEGR
jgi:hypothetical protein